MAAPETAPALRITREWETGSASVLMRMSDRNPSGDQALCIFSQQRFNDWPSPGNPGAFVAPRGLTFGNSGRNSMRNPSRINFNMSLLKHFKAFHEKSDVEFRAEAFNVFNHTQFRIYDPATRQYRQQRHQLLRRHHDWIFGRGIELSRRQFLPASCRRARPAHPPVCVEDGLLEERAMTFRKQTSRLLGKWLSGEWLSGKRARPSRLALALLATALAVILSACSSAVNTPTATASGPQLYMTPQIHGGQVNGSGADGNDSSLGTFSIDDAALTFAQETYGFNSYGESTGAQINYSGDLASPSLARGLEELELTYASGTSYSSPQSGSGWAVELAGQDGGLAQLTGNSVSPLVPRLRAPR